jgi:hypothetical protein
VPLGADAESVRIGTDVSSDDDGDHFVREDPSDDVMIASQPLFGYEPSFSIAFNEWLDNYRARVSTRLRRHLLRALSTARTSLNWPRVEELARAILAGDPLNEEATLALAEAAALTGDKIRAVSLLSSYEHETGMVDLRVSSALLRHRISERTVQRPAHEMSFRGREHDCDVVVTYLRRVSARSSLLVLSGEAGIGKTRLLEEVSGLAQLEGTDVQVVRCEPNQVLRPLGVLMDLVPSLLCCRGAIGVHPESMACLQLLTQPGAEVEKQVLDKQHGDARLAMIVHALSDLIDAVTAEVPLLIAIEDVHWADPASLRAIASLFGRARTKPIQLILTTRLASLPVEFSNASDAVVAHRLSPLDDDAMNAIAGECFRLGGTTAPADVLAWIVRHAEGNPFFLRMLCAHYSETREAYSVPPDLIAATSTRVLNQSVENRRLLEYCAMLRGQTSIDSLRELSGQDNRSLATSMQVLETAGLIRLRGNAIVVSHELLRECILGLATPISKRVLHRSVAEHLERRYRDCQDAAILWDCAEHWQASGDTEKAVQFLLQCARHTSNLGQATDALQILEAARTLASTKDQLVALTIAMTYVYRASWNWTKVHEMCAQLAALRGSNEVAHVDDELLAMEARWFTKNDIGDSTVRLLKCVAAESAPALHRLDALCLGVKIAAELCDPEFGRRIYELARPVLEANPLLVVARTSQLIFHAAFGDIEASITLARQLVADLSEMSLPDQLRAASNASGLLFIMGAFEESLSICEKYYQKSLELNIESYQQDFADRACCCCLVYDDYTRAELWHQRAEEATPAIHGRSSSFHHANAVEIAIGKRDAVRARNSVQSLKLAFGESIRFQAYLRGMEVRAMQLDPGYLCDSSTQTELRRLFTVVRSSLSMDGLVQALAEDLLRKNSRVEAADVLRVYLQERRERAPLPASFQLVLRRADAVEAN